MPAVSTLAFVAGPSTTAAVALSLTGPAATNVMVDGFTLGAPTFEADPLAQGSEYGWRTVQFTIKVHGSYSAAATAMQNIARQLVMKQNWLMFQWSPTAAPFFIRSYRTGQDALEWEDSGAGTWSLPVSLTCDPWVLGPLETIAAKTVKNDPASGTNPTWFKLPTIKGDAPTPLKVDITPAQSWYGYAPMMASAAIDPSQNPTAPIFWQAESFSAGTNTTITADAAMSGGSKMRCSFASNTLVNRVSGTAPSTPPPGTYKVLARIARSDTSSTFQSQFGVSGGPQTSYIYGDTVTMDRAASSATGHVTWMDLGEFAFPPAGYGLTIDDAALAPAPAISLKMMRLSGSGSADIDVFYLIPVDTSITWDARITRTTFLTDPIGPAGGGQAPIGSWDGTKLPPVFRFWNTAFANLMASGPPRVDGRFLTAWPGAVNTFTLIQQTMLGTPTTLAVNDNPDVLTNTASVALSYYPRYLYVRPDTT